MKGHKRELDSHSAFPYVSPAEISALMAIAVMTVQQTEEYLDIELRDLQTDNKLNSATNLYSKL